jgi:magnesium-transporting ATPase (P-type)
MADRVIYVSYPLTGFPSVGCPIRTRVRIHERLLTNKSLLAACSLTLLLQVAAIYWPPAQTLLHTLPLSGLELAVCLAPEQSCLAQLR